MLTPRTDRKRRIKTEHGDSPLAGHRKRKNGKAKRGLRLAKHRGKPAATDHERLLTRRKEHAGHVFPYQDEVVDIKILFVAQQSQKKEPSQQCSPQKGLIRIERMKEGVGVPKDGGLIGPGNEQSTQTFPGHGKGGDPDAVEGGTGGKELFQSLWDLQPVPLKHVQIAEQAERSKAGRHIRDGVTLPHLREDLLTIRCQGRQAGEIGKHPSGT